MAEMDNAQNRQLSVTLDHRRQWRRCRYVYPVIARRSNGLSIGVNLNPDKRCNLACVYCQIDRRVHRPLTDVDLEILHDELHLAMEEVQTGRLWADPRFACTPQPLRRLNDIAFSGDGEPTTVGRFDRAVRAAAEVKDAFDRHEVKLVVLTNATKLRSPQVRSALPILDAHNGEIWAKLDAGTEPFFQRVNRPHPKVRLAEIVENITSAALGRPLVIQSLFFRLEGHPPPAAELRAYCQRLDQVRAAGGKIKLIQVHTIARPPAEAIAAALSDEEVDAVAAVIRRALPDVAIDRYYGTDAPPQSRSPWPHLT